MPADAPDRLYREPFAGAASLFFALAPKRAVLSDLNQHLIDCYRAIRDDYEAVAACLRRHEMAHSESHYYSVRSLYNRSSASAAQAARFIYLNRTSFNGVFRVNLNGYYNVPFGDKPNPLFPRPAALRVIGAALTHTRLSVQDYAAAVCSAKRGDFVYLDPPYPPLNGTSFFTHYTPDRFSLDEQRRLAEVFAMLTKRGCVVMMTNADLPFIRRLYSKCWLTPLRVTRYVTCRRQKHKVGELVLTNYEPPA